VKKFGFQVHSTNNPALQQAITAFQPPVILALATVPGDFLQQTAQLRAWAPDATIVYRSWSLFTPGDLDHADQIIAHPPESFFGQMAGVIDTFGDDVVYHLMNETGHSDHALWRRYVAWQAEVVRIANARGLRVCCFNQGPGTPGQDEEDVELYWDEALPVYQAIAEGGYRSMIGVHEYFAGGAPGFYPSALAEAPFLVARFSYTQDAIARAGYNPDYFKIVITEYGWAKNLPTNPFPQDQPPDHDSLVYYKHYQTPDQMADIMADHHEIFYDPNPGVIGSCHFVVGQSVSPHWADYELLNHSDIMNYLLLRREDGPVDPPPEPPTEPEDPVRPTIFTVYSTIVNLNVRTLPAISAPRVTTLEPGVPVMTDAYADADGYRWRRIAGFDLWAAEYHSSDPSSLFLERVDEPVPGDCDSIREDIQNITSQIRGCTNDIDTFADLLDNL
jgi:hypothetical protein